MKKYYLILFFQCLYLASPAQQLITEIPLGSKSDLIDISGMALDSGIFISVKYRPTKNSAMRKANYLMAADGTVKVTDLQKIDGKFLFAITTVGDSTYYYFLEEKRKAISVQAWVQHKKTGDGKIHPAEMNVPGRLYANYTENGALYLVCAEKKSYSLRLIQLKGMRVEKESNFALPLDLSWNKSNTFSFFRNGPMTSLAQASATVKFIKEGNTIWITIDEPQPLSVLDTNVPIICKTTVVEVNLATGESSTKIFMDSMGGSFTSTVTKGMLIRLFLFHDKGFGGECFDLKSGKKVHDFGPLTLPATDSAYFRHSSKQFVRKQPDSRGFSVEKVSYFITIDTVRADGDLVLTVGMTGQPGSMGSSFIPGAGIVGAMAILVATTAIRDLSDGPNLYWYYYAKGSFQNGFKVMPEVTFARQQMDEYEFSQLKKEIRFDYRGYLSGEHHVFAFYRTVKGERIQVYRFENK